MMYHLLNPIQNSENKIKLMAIWSEYCFVGSFLTKFQAHSSSTHIQWVAITLSVDENLTFWRIERNQNPEARIIPLANKQDKSLFEWILSNF